MTAEGHKIISLHGALDTGARDEVMTKFRTGEYKVGLCPSPAALVMAC